MDFQFIFRPQTPHPHDVPEQPEPKLELSSTALKAMYDRREDFDFHGYVLHDGGRHYIDAIELRILPDQDDVEVDAAYVRAEAARAFGREKSEGPQETKGYVVSLRIDEKCAAFFVESIDREHIAEVVTSMRAAAIASGIDAAVGYLSRAGKELPLNILPL